MDALPFSEGIMILAAASNDAISTHLHFALGSTYFYSFLQKICL